MTTQEQNNNKLSGITLALTAIIERAIFAAVIGSILIATSFIIRTLIRTPCSACGKPISPKVLDKIIPLADGKEKRFFCSKKCRNEFIAEMRFR